MVLIVELSVIGVSFFGDFLKFNPNEVKEGIAAQAVVSTHDRIYALLDQVEKLSAPKAFALVNNPPDNTDQLRSLVAARDPSGLREKYPEVAKQLIKMQLVLGARTPATLESWSKELESQ